MSTPVNKITDLDFENIKKNLLDYVSNTSEFTNYDFDSSGLSFLLDILSYNTQYTAYYLNMISNELFLDSVQQRNNAVSIGKQLGYLPQNKKAPFAIVSFKMIVPLGTEFSEDKSFLLPKYSPFTGTDTTGEVSLPFTNIDEGIISKNEDGEMKIDQLKLFQGVWSSQTMKVDRINDSEQRFLIANKNVDLSTLVVKVKESDSDDDRLIYKVYEFTDDITTVLPDSRIFFLEQFIDGRYEIIFGDDVLGRAVKHNDEIHIEYISTEGSVGNGLNRFNFNSFIDDFGEFSIRTIEASSSGFDEESIDSIKFNIPKTFRTQNRAVTEEDYYTIIRRDFNFIDSVSVWGGEKNDPPRYGQVFCALKPKGAFLLTKIQKDVVFAGLMDRNIISTVPVIQDPVYLFLDFDIELMYDQNKTLKSRGQITNLVRSTVMEFANQNLMKFKKPFRISELNRKIDLLDNSFIGTSIKIKIYQIEMMNVGVETSYSINFNNPFGKGSLTTTRFDYKIGKTYYNDCLIKENEGIEDKPNTLGIYQNVNGFHIKIKDYIGDVYPKDGYLKLELFNPQKILGDSSEIEFRVDPIGYEFYPYRNQIIAVRSSDVSVLAMIKDNKD